MKKVKYLKKNYITKSLLLKFINLLFLYILFYIYFLKQNRVGAKRPKRKLVLNSK